MQYTFRPMPTWPHQVTKPRSYPHFKAGWRTTLDELAYEIEKIGGRDCVIGAGFRDSDIRLDGMPRANARQDPYMHPGVEISFDSRFGRLTYATDQYTDWRANVRAIALSLEALRAVLDHVKDEPRIGVRAPSDVEHLVAICRRHHVDTPWATSHRSLLRAYLRHVQTMPAAQAVLRAVA